MIDGDAVLLGVDSRSDFGLHSRKQDDEVQFYPLRYPGGRRRGSSQTAAVDAQDSTWRGQFARRVDGIFLSDFEQGEIGSDLFQHACLMGLEGRESHYRAGRFDRWIKDEERADIRPIAARWISWAEPP